MLATALGCALLAIAFLLGRLSARLPEPEFQTAVTPPGVEVAVAAAPGPAAAELAPATSPVPQSESSPPPSFGSLPPRPVEEAEASRAAPPHLQASAAAPSPAIAAYFAQVDSLDQAGTGDPRDFANSLLASVTSGDFSGFDDLLRQARRQQEGLRNLTPPAPCHAYHRLALSLSGESLAMLETLRAALAKGDTTALMAMATRAQDLEARANELKAMGDAIRRQASP